MSKWFENWLESLTDDQLLLIQLGLNFGTWMSALIAIGCVFYVALNI
jgi:hypothetical protein